MDLLQTTFLTLNAIKPAGARPAGVFNPRAAELLKPAEAGRDRTSAFLRFFPNEPERQQALLANHVSFSW